MKYVLTTFLLFVFSLSFARVYQNDSVNKKRTRIKSYKQEKLENPFETKGNIDQQFDYLYKKSTNYKNYKVISVSWYNTLKGSILDSIKSQKNIIAEKNSFIENNKQQIASLQKRLAETQNELEKTISLKESRSILGMSSNKTVFSIVITITYLTLFVLLGFFIFKYKQNIGITNKAVENLNKLKIEFEEHKKNSLKRFQEVNRKLQDELNKNWKKEK